MSAPSTKSTDTLELLMASAFADTASIVESLSTAELAAPTPCPGWDVATVVDHIGGALQMFAAALEPEGSEAEPPVALVDSSTGRVRALSETVAERWRGVESADTPIPLPFGVFPATFAMRINILETFVHGVDIAVAVGRSHEVNASRCDAVREMAELAGFDAFRQPGMFGPAIAPRDESALARLMAFVGRTL